MSEEDFTEAERQKLRAILRQFGADGSPLNRAYAIPQGGVFGGVVGKFAVFVTGGVVTLVGWLNLPADVQQAYQTYLPYAVIALDTLNTVPEPQPQQKPSEYRRETALASNTAHPDHTMIRLNTVQSTTPS